MHVRISSEIMRHPSKENGCIVKAEIKDLVVPIDEVRLERSTGNYYICDDGVEYPYPEDDDPHVYHFAVVDQKQILIHEDEFERLSRLLESNNRERADIINELARNMNLPDVWSNEDISNLTGVEV